MRQTSVRVVRRWWWIIGMVAVVLVGSGVLIGALRLRHIPDRAIGHSLPALLVAESPTKTVTYQQNGDRDATAMVSYLVPGGPNRDERVVLPWRHSIRVGDVTASVGVLAQTDGGRLRCAISVEGQVRHTASATTE